MTDEMTPNVVLDFWFSPKVKAHWFDSTPELDGEIRLRFQSLWESASNGEVSDWQDSAAGALALVIVLDQFPLNMFRNLPAAFKTEQQAVAITKQAIASGFDSALKGAQLAFLYMPLMHSESIEDQDLSVSLYEATGLTENAKFACHHRDIVRRFGRFPHRNAILGRESRAEEIAYLESPSAFTG